MISLQSSIIFFPFRSMAAVRLSTSCIISSYFICIRIIVIYFRVQSYNRFTNSLLSKISSLLSFWTGVSLSAVSVYLFRSSVGVSPRLSLQNRLNCCGEEKWYSSMMSAKGMYGNESRCRICSALFIVSHLCADMPNSF